MVSTLPSPPASPPSTLSNSQNAYHASSGLPVPRRNPLRPGSQKMVSLMSYLDERLLRIQRRYGKKFPASVPVGDDTPGYSAFEEVIVDVAPLIDVVWVSSTPSLQIAYLLSLAGTVVSYMPAFPFTPSTFRVLRKLDLAFVTLLQKQSARSNEAAKCVVSKTEKVRIKSLAENTRVVVVNTASRLDLTAHTDKFSSDEDSDDDGGDEGDFVAAIESNQDGIATGLARVYKRTLEILGDELT